MKMNIYKKTKSSVSCYQKSKDFLDLCYILHLMNYYYLN